MANVMIRRGEDGELVFYLPKKDLEEAILSLEHTGPGRWGGEMRLADGSGYFIEPLPEVPRFPITLRAKRL